MIPLINTDMKHGLAVDLEDWYHPHLIARGSDSSTTLIRNPTRRILELFNDSGVRATFFIVGEVAKRHPDLISSIAERGHEIACHGFSHRSLASMNAEEFSRELALAEEAIVAACGQKPQGFRGPSFGLKRKTEWAVEVLQNRGYAYDSSIMPSLLGLSGWATAPRIPFKIGERLWEIPASTSPVGRIPYGGSIYHRFIPRGIISQWIRSNERNGVPSSFYVHPWELLSEMPPTKGNILGRWITLAGQGRVLPNLKWLLDFVPLSPLGEAFAYLWGAEAPPGTSTP